MTVANSAAVITGLYVPLRALVFLGCMPRRGTAGSYDLPTFSFLGSLHTVSTVAAPVCLPTKSPTKPAGGLPFLHLSPVVIVHRFF